MSCLNNLIRTCTHSSSSSVVGVWFIGIKTWLLIYYFWYVLRKLSDVVCNVLLPSLVIQLSNCGLWGCLLIFYEWWLGILRWQVNFLFGLFGKSKKTRFIYPTPNSVLNKLAIFNYNSPNSLILLDETKAAEIKNMKSLSTRTLNLFER